jgi:hypothetical protein
MEPFIAVNILATNVYCKFVEVRATGPTYFVFFRLYPSPLPAATAVFGSYCHLSILSYTLSPVRSGPAYPYNWRGFVGSKQNEDERGSLSIQSSGLEFSDCNAVTVLDSY